MFLIRGLILYFFCCCCKEFILLLKDYYFEVKISLDFCCFYFVFLWMFEKFYRWNFCVEEDMVVVLEGMCKIIGISRNVIL